MHTLSGLCAAASPTAAWAGVADLGNPAPRVFGDQSHGLLAFDIFIDKLGGDDILNNFVLPDSDSRFLVGQLGQANALRHSGGAVVVSGAVAEGAVELHVLDEGPGFPPGFLGTAFERFTRSDEARASGGAGLGLAIVDVIARAHGGKAGAANRPGGGADVWLSIPTS